MVLVSSIAGLAALSDENLAPEPGYEDLGPGLCLDESGADEDSTASVSWEPAFDFCKQQCDEIDFCTGFSFNSVANQTADPAAIDALNDEPNCILFSGTGITAGSEVFGDAHCYRKDWWDDTPAPTTLVQGEKTE